MSKINKFTKCNLRKVMFEKGITFKAMGLHLGVSFQQVQKYASGDNEMSFHSLLKACALLNCNPMDIYPEIEIYDKGFNIPKTRRTPQDTENNTALSSNNDNNTKDSGANITNIYNYNTPRWGLNLLDNFFSNVKLLDINSKSSLFIKSALYFYCIFLIAFYTWRALGYSAGDHLTQLVFTSTTTLWLIGLVLPLIIKSWVAYVAIFGALRNTLHSTYDFITINMIHNNNQVSTPYEWWIATTSALLLTIIYALIIKRYFRSQKTSNKDSTKEMADKSMAS